jgi:hypothetical protein
VTGRPSIVAEVIATEAADAAPIDWEEAVRLFANYFDLKNPSGGS